MEKPFKLTVRVVWWMMIFQMLFALPFTIGSIFVLLAVVQGSAKSIPILIVLVFLAFLGWANALSTIQVTDRSVSVTVFHGSYRIAWDEVQKIIRRDYLIALVGNDKRVVLALQLMSKNRRDKLLEYFAQQIEERKIEFTTAEQVPLTQHNTRVSFLESRYEVP